MSRYTKEQIESAVKESLTWKEVCLKLGIPPATGSQTHLTKRAIKEGVDFSHFIGKFHAKGKKFPPKNPLEDYLSGSIPIKSSDLRRRLIKDGIKQPHCEVCGLSEWLNEPISLELDHKDSNHFNNCLSNLQILCPNCHSAVTTQRRKARRKRHK